MEKLDSIFHYQHIVFSNNTTCVKLKWFARELFLDRSIDDFRLCWCSEIGMINKLRRWPPGNDFMQRVHWSHRQLELIVACSLSDWSITWILVVFPFISSLRCCVSSGAAVDSTCSGTWQPGNEFFCPMILKLELTIMWMRLSKIV